MLRRCATLLDRLPVQCRMQLADCRLDLDAQVLRRGDGSVVELRPQAWGALRLLAASPGRLVSKDHFMQTLWPGVVVTDGSLAQAISDVRAALGPQGHQVIRTVARRGYMLAVQPSAPPALSTPRLLFGRDDDLRSLAALLSTRRLVSIIGAGGIGKTALALQAAHDEAGRGRRVAWVDLSSINDPAWLPAALAGALDLPLAQRADPVPALCAALHQVAALVVLDNAEHLVVEAARLVRAALDAAPALSILCTSQAPLQLQDERLFRLAGLETAAEDSDFESARNKPAVALFIEQVRAAGHHFEPGPADVAAIARIGGRLGGVPLAIRLAAGRAMLLGLDALESRLDERLAMLAGGPRDAPARQQTLQDALNWSYGLLPPPEQGAMRRLALLAGDFPPWVAAAVTGADEWQILQILQALADRSFIEPAALGVPRWRMPETMRAFGLRALGAQAEHEAARAALARGVELALLQDKVLQWNRPRDWAVRWKPELASLRMALDWAAAHDAACFASLVGQALGLFVQLDLGLELHRRMLSLDDARIEAMSPELQAHYWLARGHLEAGVVSGDVMACAVAAERSARVGPSRRLLFAALCLQLTTLAMPPDRAASHLAELRALEEPGWPRRLLSHGRHAEMAALCVAGRLPQALAVAEQGYRLAGEADSMIAAELCAFWVVILSCQLEGCARALERAAEMAPRLQRAPLAMKFSFMGARLHCLLRDGQVSVARDLLAGMFQIGRTAGWPHFQHFGDHYAEAAQADGRPEDAARLLGHADQVRHPAWRVIPVRASGTGTGLRDDLRARLEPARLAQLLEEGAALEPDSVVRLALGRGLGELA